MPSKLRKAIGAVKDQTSISLAKVSNAAAGSSTSSATAAAAASLGVTILRATTHEEVPIEDRYVDEILEAVSSGKSLAAACVNLIGRRVGRTRNWIVALKSLTLVLRIFQDGDPHFPKEVHHAMKRGAKILNLASFRDDSNSSPWDYTAFVRTFALYLDERLDCFLSGKLQRRFSYHRHRHHYYSSPDQQRYPAGQNMKSAVLLDRVLCWQRLLDRAIATQPTGAAKTNRLVHISLYAIVQESFDLYRDISDGLALLLDSFFHMQYQNCLNAFQACVKASKQFEELCNFYALCKNIGIGRTSEYPSIHKISDELIETLQEFLKDQTSFPAAGAPRSRSPRGSISPAAVGDENEQSEARSRSTRVSEVHSSDMGSQRTSSLDDFVVDDPETDTDSFSNLRSSSREDLGAEQLEKQFDLLSADDGGSSRLFFGGNDDFGCFQDWPPQHQLQQPQEREKHNAEARDGWELVLFETTSQTAPAATTSPIAAIHDASSYNPFLQDAPGIAAADAGSDFFAVAPTFQATPTFSASNAGDTTTLQAQNDPFGPWSSTAKGEQMHGEAIIRNDQRQNLEQEQQLWLEQQNKIIAKHLS